jgi:copper chaperone CopZ
MLCFLNLFFTVSAGFCAFGQRRLLFNSLLPVKNMHSYTHILISFLLVLCAVGSHAQKAKPVTASFWVAGVCGRCETTIEKALDTRGVITADYDLKAHALTVVFNPSKITEADIHALLNDVGYDTASSRCTDEQYSRTHSCCKYREMSDH